MGLDILIVDLKPFAFYLDYKSFYYLSGQKSQESSRNKSFGRRQVASLNTLKWETKIKLLYDKILQWCLFKVVVTSGHKMCECFPGRSKSRVLVTNLVTLHRLSSAFKMWSSVFLGPSVRTATLTSNVNCNPYCFRFAVTCNVWPLVPTDFPS